MNKLTKVKNGKILVFGDIVVMILCLALIIAITFMLKPTKIGSQVKIYQNAKLIATLPLEVDREYQVTNGDNHNTVVVENKKVYIKNASCSDKLCENKGEISMVNEQIICLPNGVRVEIDGEGEIDAIS